MLLHTAERAAAVLALAAALTVRMSPDHHASTPPADTAAHTTNVVHSEAAGSIREGGLSVCASLDTLEKDATGVSTVIFTKPRK